MVENLLEKPFIPLEMIEMFKKIQHLPRSSEEMIEKFMLLTGKLMAGNTMIIPQIVAFLTKLYKEKKISCKDYKSLCKKLHIHY